jgi:hypothetical protein
LQRSANSVTTNKLLLFFCSIKTVENKKASHREAFFTVEEINH